MFKFRPCGVVLDTKLCDKICQLLATGRWFSPGTAVSCTIKIYRHDQNEILLKGALNSITITFCCSFFLHCVCIWIVPLLVFFSLHFDILANKWNDPIQTIIAGKHLLLIPITATSKEGKKITLWINCFHNSISNQYLFRKRNIKTSLY